MKIHEIVIEQRTDEGPLDVLKAAANSGLVKKAANWQAGKGTVAAAKGGIQDAGTILKAFGNLGTNFAKLISSLGVVYVLGKTYFNIQALNKKYQAGQITPAVYEQQLQAELGFAATQLVAAGLVKAVLGLGVGIMSTIPILKWFAPLAKWATGPAGAAFMVWLQSSAGQEAFAKWFVGAIMEESIAGGAIDLISTYTKKFYDMILQRTQDAEKNAATAKTTTAGDTADGSEPDDDFFKNVDTKKPSDAQEFDPATGTWLNKP